jgi:hypothetical protein
VLPRDLGRLAEAEQRARPLPEEDEVSWPALVLVAQCLRARGADAAAFVAEHDIDEEDVDDI